MIGVLQRRWIPLWGEILDVIHWFIFLVTAIDSGQVLSRHKGGSYNVACNTYRSSTNALR